MIIIILSTTWRIVFTDCTMLYYRLIFIIHATSPRLSAPPPAPRKKKKMYSISLPQFNYLPLKTPSTNYANIDSLV